MDSSSDPLVDGLQEFITFKIDFELLLIEILAARVRLKKARTLEEAKEPMADLRVLFKKFKTMTMDFQTLDFYISKHLDNIILDLDGKN